MMTRKNTIRVLALTVVIASALMLSLPSLRAQEPNPDGRNRRSGIREFLGLGAPPDPVAAKRGEPLYAAHCAFCHGPKARGAEGPNLIRSVLVLHDEGGKQIGPYLLKGNPEKGMPAFATLTESQTYDLAQFLHMQVELTANRGVYQRLNVVTGDARKGAEFFNGAGKCNTCHAVTGDLAGIGSRLPPDAIQNRFLWPGGGGFGSAPPVRKVTVTLADGQQVTGVARRLDDFYVSLYDEQGNFHAWSRTDNKIKVEIEDRLQAHRQLLAVYTDEIMHNLTAYLVTLK